MLQLLHHIRRQKLLLIAIALITLAVGLPLFSKQQPVTEVPIEQEAQTPVAAPAVAPVTQAAHDRATTVLELFNPSDLSLTHQLNETAISQQVEQIMSTSYVLSRCNLMDKDEYRDTFRALILFAQHNKLATDAAGAEEKVRQLAKSASVSYQMLYSRTRCDDPKLPVIARQLLNWQRIYLHQ